MKLSLFRLSHSTALGILVILAVCRVSAAPVSPFTLVSGVPKTLTPAALTAAQGIAMQGQISADKKTITFHQKSISLVVVTGPDNDMLSYRIADLRNPTLIMPRGATITALFVNADDDMFHNLRFGTAPLKASVGAPPLPHKSETAYHAELLTLRVPAQAGPYAYFCTVRGHAQGGMIGMVIVR